MAGPAKMSRPGPAGPAKMPWPLVHLLRKPVDIVFELRSEDNFVTVMYCKALLF